MEIIVKESPHLGTGWGVGGVRGYNSPADRKRAIKAIFKTGKANHFTCFMDVQSRYALQYGASNWVMESNRVRADFCLPPAPYVNW